MVKVSFRQVIALSIAGSMLVSSTAAAAAPVVAPTQQIDPWAALSVLSAGAPAAALCGSAATAAEVQPAGGCVLPAVDVAFPAAPPPPPAPPLPLPSLWPALGAIAAIVGGYFLVNGHKSQPVSPA